MFHEAHSAFANGCVCGQIDCSCLCPIAARFFVKCAIGDDDNDAEMLESAGLAGIAMKYAAVGAKQAVDLGLEWMDH